MSACIVSTNLKRAQFVRALRNLWGADLISVLSGGNDRKIALCHINVVGNPTNRLMVSFRPLVAAIYRKFDRVVAVREGTESAPISRICREAEGHIVVAFGWAATLCLVWPACYREERGGSSPCS
jgi:hypothetical protein